MLAIRLLFNKKMVQNHIERGGFNNDLLCHSNYGVG